jgi:fluoride ion exporter CrcB/FEX
MGFSEDETFVLMVGTGVCGGLSILGSLFIIFSALLFRKLDLQYWRFVVGLTLVDLLLGICMVRPPLRYFISILPLSFL